MCIEDYVKPQSVSDIVELLNSPKVEIILKNGFKVVASKENFTNYEQFKINCCRP
jgi:hypothetical protein